jgi:phosphoglycolate phosphatase|tara:strand:+ start:20548 stop:21258 length:711 start_codon:yes stop_codon:yes gene_type:complete
MNNAASDSLLPVEAVLFDLDGTLLDTADDLVNALDALLATLGRPPADRQIARSQVSQGSFALTRLGFPEVIDSAEFERLRLQFLDHYNAAICVDTVAYAGIKSILEWLEASNIPWGVVTNKPGWLTAQVLAQMGLEQRAACVVSGDTLPLRKPHPEPLLLACQQIQRQPQHCLYVGDDPRDIHAGNAAGMYTAVAAYGYVDPQMDVNTWGADFVIDQPLAIQQIISLSPCISKVKN